MSIAEIDHDEGTRHDVIRAHVRDAMDFNAYPNVAKTLRLVRQYGIRGCLGSRDAGTTTIKNPTPADLEFLAAEIDRRMEAVPDSNENIARWEAWHKVRDREKGHDRPDPQPRLHVVRPDEEADLTNVASVVADAWASTSSGARGEPDIITLDQVLSEPRPERDWLPVFGRDGFMVRGESHLLSAEAGAGKTFFLSGVMAELAERGERIAWVYEDGEAMVRDRRDLMAAHLSGATIKGTIGWFAADDIGRPEWIADYAIKKLDPTIIIIDTIATILRFENENDSAEASRKLRPWTRLAHDTGIAVVLVHHNNKLAGARGYGSIRGSSALVASIGVTMQLDKHGKDLSRRDLHVSKRIPVIEGVYRENSDGRLVWDDKTPVAARKSTNVRDVVYEEMVAADGQSLNEKDLSARLPNYEPSTIRAAANELARTGELTATPAWKGAKRTWRLADPDADDVDKF